jgi:sugar lactone lactonase YvrE
LALLAGTAYIADVDNEAIRAVDLKSFAVTTLAGGINECTDLNGVGLDAGFCNVHDLLAYQGNLIATDDTSLRLVTPAGVVTTWAGQLIPLHTAPTTSPNPGPFAVAEFGFPQGLAAIGSVVYSDAELGGLIYASDPTTQVVTQLTTVAGGQGTTLLGGMTAIGDLLYVSISSNTGSLESISASGQVQTLSGATEINDPDGLCTDGHSVYICESGGNTVRQYDPSTGQLSLVAGSGLAAEQDGNGVAAAFDRPAGCAFDSTARTLYVTDSSGQTLRAIR